MNSSKLLIRPALKSCADMQYEAKFEELVRKSRVPLEQFSPWLAERWDELMLNPDAPSQLGLNDTCAEMYDELYFQTVACEKAFYPCLSPAMELCMLHAYSGLYGHTLEKAEELYQSWLATMSYHERLVLGLTEDIQ